MERVYKVAREMTHQPGKDGKPGRKIRADARRMAEMVLTLPSELVELEGAERDAAESAWLKASDDWVRTQPGHLIGWAIHRDEARLHMHCFICPVTPDGRLSYKDCYGSPAKLRAAQRSYSEALAPLGVVANSEEVKAELADGYGDDVRTYKKRKEAMKQREEANTATAQALADQVELTAAQREENAALQEERDYWRGLFHAWRGFTNRLAGYVAELADLLPGGAPPPPEPPDEPEPPPTVRRRTPPESSKSTP